jgi:methylmalonyl-CoA mutase, N-terminal domain
MLRFHAQTAGVQLTAQQPENNIVRVAIQALAAVLGGTQSLHCNSYDEALALPTEKAARIALRTQQILLHEAGVDWTADPLGGSWFVEHLTREVETRAREYLKEIEKRGGAVRCIEYMMTEIEQSAFREAQSVERGDRIVVGVNRYGIAEEEHTEILRVERAVVEDQLRRLAEVRATRDGAAVKESLEDVRAAARGADNLLPPMREALRRLATIGEVCNVLREVFGVYRPAA